MAVGVGGCRRMEGGLPAEESKRPERSARQAGGNAEAKAVGCSTKHPAAASCNGARKIGGGGKGDQRAPLKAWDARLPPERSAFSLLCKDIC